MDEKRSGSAMGFTLIEIIVVVAILAGVYAVALPNLNFKRDAEVSARVNALAADFRSAFDVATLSGKSHRLVFQPAEGVYWLEVTDKRAFSMGDEKRGRDLAVEEEQTEARRASEQFDEALNQYGEAVEVDGEKIMPPSPLGAAKEDLAAAQWEKIENSEWSGRSLGPDLLLTDVQAEHHATKQRVEELGSGGVVAIYVYPGYTERAVLHLAFRKSGLQVDETKPPYTIVTEPYSGTVRVENGVEEVDVNEPPT